MKRPAPETIGSILAIAIATLIVALIVLGSLLGLGLVLDGLHEIAHREIEA